ncbi:MAG: hypothetical protein M1817_001281 [Caeruleum heppii]|nr:MAG: hypothetical protein M1817_001281 [Caeruleum heppii]
MLTLLRHALLLGVLAPLTLADVEFTSPAPGASLSGGSTIAVEWKDSGDPPSIKDLQSYSLFLCAGGNENPIQLAAITDQGAFTRGNKASGTIQAGLGASTPENAYFLKMISAATTGGTVINYSGRFSLESMTGTFPPQVLADLADVEGTEGPPTENTVVANNINNPGAAAGPQGPFNLPYTLQTGNTKFAPMQPLPPTKITAKGSTRLWPTSDFSIATTWLPIPSVVTTLTQSATHAVTSRTNTTQIAPAANPTDDMGKFLNRWKD